MMGVMFPKEYMDYKYRRSMGLIKDFEYDPFDVLGVVTPPLSSGVKGVICNDKSPCSTLVTLYGWMGIHRYNFLQGKNYQFSHVERYTYSLNFGSATTYYITSVAKDPADGLLKHFHIKINQKIRNRLLATCTVAVLRGEPNIEPKNIILIRDRDWFPQWPRENPFKDTKRFHLVNNSELQDNANDWIRLYLELAVATDRQMRSNDGDLSNLEIIKVAIETAQDPNKVFNKVLGAKNATLYIAYRDPSEARVGKDVDRIAIVSRLIDERNGCLTLRGHNQSSAIILKKAKTRRAHLLFMRRSAVLKPSRSFFARQRKSYRNCGVGTI